MRVSIGKQVDRSRTVVDRLGTEIVFPNPCRAFVVIPVIIIIQIAEVIIAERSRVGVGVGLVHRIDFIRRRHSRIAQENIVVYRDTGKTGQVNAMSIGAQVTALDRAETYVHGCSCVCNDSRRPVAFATRDQTTCDGRTSA